MALVGGPIVELLNYCTAVKFDSFEAAESEQCSKCLVYSLTMMFRFEPLQSCVLNG